MVGIQQIGGIVEPTGASRAQKRDRKVDANQRAGEDQVAISSEARAAAIVQRLVENAGNEQGVRAEEVARARENLQQGTYKVQRIVLQVAARIAPYVAL